MQNPIPHAALLASPGLGHLIPVLELAKTLVDPHGFRTTIFVIPIDQASTAQNQLFKSPNPDLIDIVVLPFVDISDLVDSTTSVVTSLVLMMRESLPLLRSAIFEMKVTPTVLVVDLFGTEAFDVADEFGMLKYVFDTTNAWFLAATIYAPTLDRRVLEEHAYDKIPLRLPGCRQVLFEDTLEAFLDPKDPTFEVFLELGKGIPKGDGILVNSWQELEATTFKALEDKSLLGRVARVPVYPIGPLVRGVASTQNSNVISWLDKQPMESVLYVSFGSGGTLSSKQITELAWGLELSQQRFVWVVRPPMDDDKSGSYFSAGNGNGDGTPDFLPEGFVARTRDIGLVVPSWAPQREILAHPAVGGFLSHCGWNSTLESITNGVPMIAWPLCAEQKMNGTMLVEELGVALRAQAAAYEDVVGKEEIKKMVRKILVEEEGEEMRKRMREVKYSAQEAVNKGGSSLKSLSQVASNCKIRSEDLGAKSKGARGDLLISQ
ncbi:UDP-glycosyltransferase 72E1-like [Carica papaya]|uniref:UDP-glycosyltransferase 72E1-like n=1 Tax=Carica papaya TaxID=3649 RepID=UPI000B8CFD48|nr:UDP-glycosyltransferase 72E1-like [Carica papaya]